MRIAKTIVLSDCERLTLMKWSRGRSTPGRLVQPAKIILAAADGMRNDEIASELGCTRRTVGAPPSGVVDVFEEDRCRNACRIGSPLIVDNYATHRHPKVQSWLKRHRRFHMHFIPTSSSWLNVIERWFRDITERRIRRGTFRSVEQLEAAIEDHVNRHNASPKSFVWTAKADEILEKVRRARAALNKIPTA